MKTWFRNFIIGDNAARLQSEADYKRVLLRGNLALVGLFVGIAYILIDHSNGIHQNNGYYIACSVISLATIGLIRAGKYTLSALLFLSAMGLLIFFFSASDSYQTGVYIFFIASSLTSFVLFGYEERRIALWYAGISLVLFFTAYWTDHSYIQPKELDPQYVKLSYTLNFVVALITCMAIVYFLIDLNFHSEKEILAKNEQLAKANAELDRFVYSASHDMRAPLSSILGLIQVYRLSSSAEEKEQVVELIRNRANKLDDFIREILDYSRNARLSVKPVPLNPVQVASDVIEGLRFAQDFDRVKIDIIADADITVPSDVDRLKVILNNVVGNAVKYHDPYKDSSWVKISIARSEVTWNITIEDNGIGIPEIHQGNIFGMFYRAHEKSEGSGLGLYIAQETANRLGGSITLTSTPGAGSIFKMVFPITLVSVMKD